MAGRSMFRTKMVECVICVSVSFERTSLMAGRSMFRLWFYFEGFFLIIPRSRFLPVLYKQTCTKNVKNV